MIAFAGWLSPTRFIGLNAYVFAAACCGIAWVRGSGASRQSRLAASLMVLEAGLVLDMVFSIRWQVHDLLEAQAVRGNLYAQRAGPQLAALGFLSVAAAAGMVLAFMRLRGRTGAIVASWGAILSLSCWCAEVISLHATDTALYRTVDGIMIVSLWWLACSLMTGLGVLWDLHAARSHDCYCANPSPKPPSSITDT